MALLREPSTALDPIGPLETCLVDVSVDHPGAALRSAFRDFTHAVLEPCDVDRMLRLLTGQVVSVFDVDGACVSLAPGGGKHLQVATATDDDIAAVGEQQVSAGEGPAYEVYLTGEQITVADLELEDRWPTYRQVGLERGMRAVACIPMPNSGCQRIGALHLYRHRPHRWGREELETAQLLADMAAGYMIHARADGERARSESNLKRALESRDVIGQAKGILMTQQRLTAEASFDLLRRTSQAQNVKLREIAAQVVETGELPDETD